MMTAREIAFEDITLGQTVSFEKIFTSEDVSTFAHLSGDHNPLHVDALYASTTKFKEPIVHGMLVASLCSTCVGMYLPGKKCLYLGQNIRFKAPVYPNDMLTVTGKVVHISTATNTLNLDIHISSQKGEVLSGEAFVQIL